MFRHELTPLRKTANGWFVQMAVPYCQKQCCAVRRYDGRILECNRVQVMARSMVTRKILAATAIIFLAASCGDANNPGGGNTSFTLQQLVTGLSSPLGLEQPNDG